MTFRFHRAALLGTVALPLAFAATAVGAQYFDRVATYPVYNNLPADSDPATETVAEIVAATEDGMLLAYTDGAGDAIGFVDITDPSAPVGDGRTALEGEPTSVAVKGGHAYAGVNTAESYVDPTGHLAVISLDTREVVATCDAGGQPDSVAVSPDGAYVAVVIENERDEDLNDGIIPQLPAGTLAIFDLNEDGTVANCDAARFADLTGLAAVAPTDPEPEYVDINDAGHAVVTMQENNHLAIVDLATGTVAADFDAGSVDLTMIDTAEEDIIDPTSSLDDVPREADAVSWIDGDRFVTADEGDYEGGSRGFTIYNSDGSVAYTSGNFMEHLAIRHGHYPEGRSENKGTEPEGVDVGMFGEDRLIFVNSERGNFVAVFRDTGGEPEYLQFLPTAVAPEGLLAIPQRDLFVVATEEDAAEDKIRSTLTIFERSADAPFYPHLASADAESGAPIAWSALSAAVADDEDASTIYTINDSAYAVSTIYTVDVSQTPAIITEELTMTLDGAPVGYDPEGIALAADGGFWVASEGHAGRETPNLIIKVAADGAVEQEIHLPDDVVAGRTNNGFEGIASFMADGEEHLIVAQQRTWEQDPAGHVKLGIYTPSSESWSFVAYPMNPATSPNGGWVGLSEITHLGDMRFAIIERDNQTGSASTFKVLTTVDLAGVTPVAHGEDLPVIEKTIVFDLLPVMRSTNAWIGDKPEGLAVTLDGRVILITDNDGVDDAPGETQLIDLGSVDDVLN